MTRHVSPRSAYVLVCEGPCSPGLAAYEAAVLTANLGQWASTFHSGTTARVAEVKRCRDGLHHTSHEHTGLGDQYRCTSCGTVRRF